MKKKRKKLMSGLLCALLLFTNIGTGQPVYAAAEMQISQGETKGPVEEVIEEESGQKTDAAVSTEQGGTETREQEDRELPEDETLDAELPKDEIPDAEEDMLEEAAVSGPDVTRIEWLRALVETFGMEVEADNYPDNYYIDIDSSSEYYRDVMLATEFGLVDVEAGDALRPDEPATREFAVHTLNHCLGFRPESGSYSFSESGNTSYPDDIQVAVEQKWFALSNGAFYPERALNETEKALLMNCAQKAADATRIDPNHKDQYEFADNVVVLSEAAARMTDEEEYTISGSGQSLQAGDIFAVVINGFPVVKKAKNVDVSGDAMVVCTESVALADAFKSINIQGNMKADLMLAEAYEPDIELYYIEGGTAERSWEDGVRYDSLQEAEGHEIDAVELVKSYPISRDVRSRFDLAEGITADISCKLSNVDESHKVEWGSAYVDIGATATFSCNVSMDVLQAVGADSSIELARVPVGGIGYLSVTLDLSLQGDVTFCLVEYVSAGIYCDENGFRITSRFYKESFTIDAHAEASVGFTATAGVDCAGAIKGSVYGKAGVKTVLNTKSYDDGQKPGQCTHVSSWLYASAGYQASADLPVYKKSWRDEIPVFTQMNSPVRVSYHYEDGTAVSRCTRGNAALWKYYTPADSRYGYNGVSGGTGADGEPYTIFEYTLDKYENATITKYNGNVSALNIPETLDGYTVVGIGDKVFQNNKELRMVVIPDSVSVIGTSAFLNCNHLGEITLSKNIEKLGSGAFGNCVSLTSVLIPKSLTVGGGNVWNENLHGAFGGCSTLSSVAFEEGTTQIASYLFYNCIGLKEIKIPDTVTKIDSHAFHSAVNLKKVQLGNAVTEIAEDAFNGCAALTDVMISDSVIKIGDHAFSECTALSQIVIPDSVSTIGTSAFLNCRKLEIVTLSKGLENLGSGAFGNCVSLTSVLIPKSLTVGGGNVWNENLHGAFGGCSTLSSVAFEEGTTQIASYLFYNCTGLKEITIPDTVTKIQENAFYSANNLKKVKIGNKVEEIKSNAFNGCTSLESIETPESTKTFGSSCFRDCKNLKSAVIHATKTSMGTNLFNGCSSLETVTLPVDKTVLEEGMFRECTSLKKIAMPDTLQTVGNYAFYNCDALTVMTLPKGVTSVGNQAFYDCDALTAVHIPDSVTSLGGDLFYSCDALRDVTLGLGLSVIPANTFLGCGSLAEIVIPYYVKELGNASFKNCTSLTSVTMPRGLAKIGTEVFSYPRKMTIYGISGTYAEEYAKANNITFVDRQTHAAAVEMPEKLTMVRGAAKTLVVSVTPSDFTDEITWKSADENIVTVDDRGKVTARAIGSTTVKVMVGSVSAVCQVTVVQPVTSVRVTPSKIEAEAAEVFALTAEVNPVDAYDKSILWSSSDETVVTVTQEGQIMTLAKGTAVITASAQDGSGKSGNCKVTVTNNAVFTSAVSELESAHPYENNSSNIWVYTAEGAGQLNVTFDEQTELEDGFDYLFLYDEDGKEIGKYTGKELAGKTVTISGSMVRIRLVSDKAGTAWGFKVTEISTEGRTEDPGGDPGTPDDGPGKDPDDVTYGDLTIKAVPNMSYTGKAVKPAVQVYYGNTLLKAGKNYTIRYENNVDADQINVKGGVLRTDSNEDTGFDNRLPYAKITGKGNFAGTVYVNFHILPVSISDGKGEIAPGFAMKYTDQFVVSGKDQRIIRSMKYKKVMQENVDYTVTLTSLDDGRTMPGGAYLPAGSQGTFKLTIRGRGGFTGTVEKMICAADKDHLLKNAKITLGKNIKKQKYTGEEITLVPSQDNGDDVFTVRMGGVYLKYGQDYEIVYTDNRAAGTAVMTVVGKAGSGYMGSKSIKFQITGKPFNTRTVTVGADFKSSFVYTGSAVTQDEVTLTSEGKTLIRDKDYRIVYRNNVRAGTASMTFEALPLSGYSGKFVKKFKIEKVPLSVSMLEDKELTAVCTPEGAKPTLILTDRGRILREGTDYIMNCSRNKAVGTASVTLKGKGNYGGSFSTIFTVTPKSLNDSDITIKPKGMAYVADKESAYRPGVQILQGRKAVSAKEYEIVYSANTSAEIAAYKSGNSEKKPVMTVRAKAGGSYTGEVELELPVYETRLTSADMEIKVGEAVYTGSQVRPDVEVSFGGRKRTEGRDYVLTYGANIAAGKKKGSVTVTGLGLEYGGSVTVKFDISGRNLGK